MKRSAIFFIGILMMLLLVGCTSKSGENSGTDGKNATEGQVESVQTSDAAEKKSVSEDRGSEQNETQHSRVAVVYFSGTGKTKAVAEVISEKTEADLYEIVPSEEYSDDDLNYNDDNCRANKEQNDRSSRPEIGNDLSATCDYDVIYLGYPIWWGTVPRIIQTYFEQYDVSHAAVYTFCTSGSSGIEKSILDLQSWYPEINIVSGSRFDAADEAEIQAWLDRLN